MADDRLEIVAMLARWPEVGQSKSRLACEIGERSADRIYRAMLQRCVDNAKEASQRGNRRLIVFVEPAGRRFEMARLLGGGVEARPQSEGDLGLRMRRAAQDSLELGAGAVVLIGSDCPALSASRLDEAFERLGLHPVILGPAADGGFYALGVTRIIKELFEPLPWGTERVFDSMVGRCGRLGIAPAVLEVLSDVDRAGDLTEEVLGLLRLSALPRLPGDDPGLWMPTCRSGGEGEVHDRAG